MKNLFLLILLFSLAGLCRAQSISVGDYQVDPTDPVLIKKPVKQQQIDTSNKNKIFPLYGPLLPEFKNRGLNGFADYIHQHIVYPKQALENKIEGTVRVLFLVDTNGMVTNCKVIEGIGYDCEDQIIAAIKNAGKWRPAISNNKPAAVREIVAVQFKLVK
jgi:protein TonB